MMVPTGSGASARSSRTPVLPADADFTIKAEAGVRPVLKLAADASLREVRPAALLHLVGGHAVIEGVEFDLDAADDDDLTAAIRCDDTELVLRGCSFRRPHPAAGDGRGVVAILVRAARARPGGSVRPPAVFADYCHFDGGQAAVRAEGPADITLKDCTMGPAAPRSGSTRPRPARRSPASFA